MKIMNICMLKKVYFCISEYIIRIEYDQLDKEQMAFQLYCGD